MRSRTLQLSFTAILAGTMALSSTAAAAQEIDLRQGWTGPQRVAFWFGPQGSRIMPYSWFIGLEQAASGELLSAPAFLESLGFIPVPGHRLPIGFEKHENQRRTATYVGLTCAACHTARLVIEGKPVIVEGGPALIDFSGFLDAMAGSTSATLKDDAKFKRFAERVNVTTPSELAQLRGKLTALDRELTARRDQNAPAERYGYGRVDAFGHIFNRVFATAIKADANRAVPDAPVSFPVLWDTPNPHHEKVQWNWSAPNPFPGDLFRNIGELLGVFGHFDLTTSPLGAPLYRNSSVREDRLNRLEQLVKRLYSPVWPRAATGPMQINDALASRGAGIYEKTCSACHKVMGSRTDPNRTAGDKRHAVGTDPTMAVNHVRRLREQRLQTGLLKGRMILASPLARFGDTATGDDILTHVIAGVYAGQTIPNDKGLVPPPPPPPPQELAAAGDADVGYKARPLNGIWATAPYLHNGSVPNLREMLKRDRVQGFWVGSNRFDPENVGLFSSEQTPRSWWFDASKPGNRNYGHQFGVDLPADDKNALIEYLKTL
jgi:mono/diheme cytochrome c family protein